MKRVIYQSIGNPSIVLQIEEVPSQPLTSGQIRVQVLATPIHPSNLLKISGQYGIVPNLPETPGTEGVGRVSEIAADVEGIQPGQLVFLAGYSTWQQEVVGPAMSFIPLPEGDIQQLSMLMINPITALRLLDSFVTVQDDEWVIQNAANSAVGSYLVQIAKARGCKVINVVRRQSAVQPLRDLGAEYVFVDGPDLVTQVGKLTKGSRVSLAIDAVGGESFTKLVQTLSFRGTIVCYGLMSMTPPTLPSTEVIFNEITVKGFWLAKWFENVDPADKQTTFGEVIRLISTGELMSPIAETYSLDDIHAAVTSAASGGRAGKVLLLPNG